MSEKMTDVSKGWNEEERVKEKNSVAEINNAFDGQTRRLHTAVQSVSFKICQRKVPKLKCKEKKIGKIIQDQWDNYKLLTYIHIIQIMNRRQSKRTKTNI
jgi:hypothetical protein